MSSMEEETVAGSSELCPKMEAGAEGEPGKTSQLESDIFGDIDKRLGLLLDRANKLETTLNKMNCKTIKDNQAVDSEPIDNESDDDNFEDDSMFLTAAEDCNTNLSDIAEMDDSVENIDAIFLDIQED